jgi:hypothetical protein
MVKNIQDYKENIAIIKEWYQALPKNIADEFEQDFEYEFVFTIKAKKTNTSGIEFRIGKHDGKSSLAIGQGIQFDGLELSDKLIIEILDSVKKGKVKETIIEHDGKLISSQGILNLPRKPWYCKRSNFWGKLWYGAIK